MTDPVPVIAIRREDAETKGRYVATIAGIAEEAELTVSKVSPTLIIADHTGVPDAMRGMKVGDALAQRLVADARVEGFRIVPLCPFVNAWMKKRPEAADVFKA